MSSTLKMWKLFFLCSIVQYFNEISQGRSQDFPKGVLNLVVAFSADKNSLPKTMFSYFDSAHLSVYDYSHYIAKRKH